MKIAQTEIFSLRVWKIFSWEKAGRRQNQHTSICQWGLSAVLSTHKVLLLPQKKNKNMKLETPGRHSIKIEPAAEPQRR